MTTLLDGFPVVTEIPVAWGDMDALQHVNNVMYFRYFETARIDYFKRINLMENIAITQIGPVVSETSCRYKMPVTFPDTLLVGSKITDLQNDRFTMKYQIVSKKHNKITTLGSATVVMFDFKSNEKASLTPEVLAIIQQLENLK
ncbi:MULTISPECIES: acyl-CoA thioesterase [Vibrio]|uniref:Acyl-CoA thioesterase n=1 Tax=Vibrio casei TaxID=673372 RepID=A0A368LNP3_9VIBR|nr:MULTISPECIES: thioesterase family protein [Vibrio]RCS73477.1 acyl-CoA thioesterase [Vibrio casei]HBV76947.1 acyl-CoA thioesterase [Vibrio sp.]